MQSESESRSTPSVLAGSEFFLQLLESSVDGICGLGRDGRCTFFNDAGAALLGYAPGELVGQMLHEQLQRHRSDGSFYPTADSRISQAARSGTSIRVNNEVFWHRDGTAVPVTYSLSPIIEDGMPTGAVITFFDFTDHSSAVVERNRLHKEIDAANKRFAEIFKQAPAFMCVLRGPAHVFELINDRYLQLVGNRRDLVGKTVKEGLPEIAGQGFLELLDRVFQTGEPFFGTDMPVYLQRLPDTPPEQRVIDLSYIALRDADGVISGILAHGVDQTDRSIAQMAFRSSEQRYRTLVTSMDEGFCIVELMFDSDARPVDYRFLEINPAFEKHSGLRDGVGRTIREMVPEFEQRWIDLYAEILATGEPARIVDQSLPMARWFDVYACRIGEAGSRQLGIIFNDITERMRVEESLRQIAADLSEADRRKSEFLATLAHELRNPLAPIRSGLGVMRLSGANPTMVAKVLEMMDRQVDHMVHLIDDLMDIARISGGKVELRKQPVELKTMLASAIETSLPLIEAGKHELVVDMADELLMLDADATRIAQTFANLLNNAAKYTPSGGKITLSAYRQHDDAVIAVSDNGVGLEPGSLSVIFDMFNQVGRDLERAQGGLGIGLSLVRRLVEMHGGTVVATSDGMHRGAQFTVRLPLAQVGLEPVCGVQPPPAGQPALVNVLRVMVVDDNVDAAQTLCAILEMRGHTVSVGYNGLQALEIAKECHPEIAFLDIGMPGMNGYETAQALRKLAGLENIVLIALTGWGTPTDRDRSREAGFDHHLTKPADLATIDALMSKIARRRAVN